LRLNKDRYGDKSTALLLVAIYNHYPSNRLSTIRLKLYFFQIVKERNSNDL
jgi:hypothetical protein